MIIPTYNEAESLPILLSKIEELAVDTDILVVDDGSPDGTGTIADERAARNDRIHVLHRTTKDGLAAAYLAGFEWGLERDYTHLVEMDADGSHRPIDLPLLIERAGMSDAPDLVIGSRWMPGGSVVNWPAYRQFLSRGGNVYIRSWLGLPYTDITAGFRVYRADALRRIDFREVNVEGYFFQTDMTIRFHELGLKIVDMPITFVEREAGESKMSKEIFVESLKNTTLMGFKHRSAQAKEFASSVAQKFKK